MKRNKLISLMVFALSIIGCVFTSQTVNAQTATLTYSHSGYWWTRTSSTEETHSWYTEDYYFGDRVAYCIEPGIPEGNIYDVGTWDNTKYSNDIKSKVLLIAYYGYDYTGHQTTKYRLATQALIWETVGSYNITYSTERWGAGTIIDVSAEKNEIMRLVNSHYTRPSFNGKTIELKVGESITLTDTNNVLSNYDVTMSNNVEYSVNGNQLTIRAINVGNITMNFKKKMYTDRQYLIYYGDGIQDMISSGVVDPVYVTLNIKSNGGDVEFDKYDKDLNKNEAQGVESTLEGAVYGVYDAKTDALISQATTDSNGHAKITNLPYFGEFYLKEISPSQGYQLDDGKYYFTSSLSNIDNYVIVKEKIINADIELTKVYATDESKIMTPEIDVEFGFYGINGNLYKTGTTDKNGKLLVNLVYGTYTVKQLTTSKDTTKVEDFTISVYEMSDTKYYTISNAEITAKLKVIKIDKDTQEVIERANIKFKIKNLDTGEYVTQTITYPKTQKISVFETDDNGILITPYPLESGRYVLEEVDQAIDGYLWNSESVEFTIGDNSELINDEDYGILFEVKFENKEVKGKVEINKFGEEIELTENGFVYTKISLEGVKIGLYANEDIYSANGKLMFEKDELVETLITDENGYVYIDDLYLGKYYLQEIETTLNHVLDKTKYTFELEYLDQYTGEITFSITLENHLPKGTLEFTKTDFSTSETLPDTLIEIYTEDGKLVVSQRTDSDGKITIEELPVGKYYIVEKEAPEGYQLNTEKMYFEITEDGEVVKATMTDEAIPLVVEVPNTSKDELPILPIAIICSLLGLGLVIYGKKKN